MKKGYHIAAVVGLGVGLAILLVILALVSCAPAKTPTPTTKIVPAEEMPTLEAPPTATVDPYSEVRKKMVRDTMRLRDIADEKVLAVMEKVPRHEFVPEEYLNQAYEDHPLPIGYGQTISQPYIVALMTDLLGVGPAATVLEVGTGSGYQAAVLSGLVASVSTIEIVPQLGERAREVLQRLGYDNVEVRIGDGYYGWEERAPFDAIIVTAASSHVPPPLIRQLKPGGRMLSPVGSRFMVQELLLVEKTAAGEVSTRQILPVTFVPLTGGH